jgi:hypothetical protein
MQDRNGVNDIDDYWLLSLCSLPNDCDELMAFVNGHALMFGSLMLLGFSVNHFPHFLQRNPFE